MDIKGLKWLRVVDIAHSYTFIVTEDKKNEVLKGDAIYIVYYSTTWNINVYLAETCYFFSDYDSDVRPWDHTKDAGFITRKEFLFVAI